MTRVQGPGDPRDIPQSSYILSDQQHLAILVSFSLPNFFFNMVNYSIFILTLSYLISSFQDNFPLTQQLSEFLSSQSYTFFLLLVLSNCYWTVLPNLHIHIYSVTVSPSAQNSRAVSAAAECIILLGSRNSAN